MSQTPEPEPEGSEPWYYGFLSGVAYLLIVLGELAAVGLALSTVGTALPLAAAVHIFIAVMATAVGAVVVPALILLLVDIGRGLRGPNRR